MVVKFLHHHVILIALFISTNFQPSSSFVYQSNSVHSKKYEIKNGREIRKSYKYENVRGGDLLSQSGDGMDGAVKVPPSQPTLKELLNFALPCLGLWISGKELSRSTSRTYR